MWRVNPTKLSHSFGNSPLRQGHWDCRASKEDVGIVGSIPDLGSHRGRVIKPRRLCNITATNKPSFVCWLKNELKTFKTLLDCLSLDISQLEVLESVEESASGSVRRCRSQEQRVFLANGTTLAKKVSITDITEKDTFNQNLECFQTFLFNKIVKNVFSLLTITFHETIGLVFFYCSHCTSRCYYKLKIMCGWC